MGQGAQTRDGREFEGNGAGDEPGDRTGMEGCDGGQDEGRKGWCGTGWDGTGRDGTGYLTGRAIEWM